MMMMQQKNNEKALRSKTVDIKKHTHKKKTKRKPNKKTEPEVDVIETYIDRRRGLRFLKQKRRKICSSDKKPLQMSS